MAKIAHELLADLDKETVDFGPNYDGSEKEPLVMPTRLPNLLVNGSGGVAVGMATNIPPHNLNEVVDDLHLLRNPEATIDELMEIVPAPDFPTAGIIYGVNRETESAGHHPRAHGSTPCARHARAGPRPGSARAVGSRTTPSPKRPRWRRPTNPGHPG